MRSIGVVSVGRSDYGIYKPVLERIRADAELELMLFVGGSHLSAECGLTVEAIQADGFVISERAPAPLDADTPEGIARSMGQACMAFAAAYGRTRPQVLLVLGDRYEMHAAASAAVPFGIPLAHLHGGESTEGAIDEQWRHSLTKLCHLHFASTEAYARRIVRMGEDPQRVTVSGAPSLDAIASCELLEPSDLWQATGLDFSQPTLLATFHPVTLEFEDTERHIEQLLAALSASGLPVLFTRPNADTSGRLIKERIDVHVREHSNSRCVTSLGQRAYYSAMHHAAAMVGNSSSGIIEAASFRLPVVNIGSRQSGRLRAKNVIDCGYGREEVAAGIARATSPEFRSSLQDVQNPYGDGHAAERILEVLKTVELGPELLVKRFHEPEGSE